MTEVRNIHFRRRWYYCLWASLLAASGVALVLWVLPGPRGEGKLGLRIQVKGAPAGVAAQVWSGPSTAWNQGSPVYGAETKAGADGWVNFPVQALPIVQRRWFKLPHPATADRVVVRFSAPGGASKFALFDLRTDLNTGAFRAGRTLLYEIQINWKSISDAEVAPTGIL